MRDARNAADVECSHCVTRLIGAGRGAGVNGCACSSLSASATARSSCASWPRIMSAGGVLDFDVRRDALVLDRPFSVEIVECEIGRGDAAVVDRVRDAERADQATPCARADERSELRGPEVVRERIAARARGLVDDHHLRPEDAGHGHGDRLAGPLARSSPASGRFSCSNDVVRNRSRPDCTARR